MADNNDNNYESLVQFNNPEEVDKLENNVGKDKEGKPDIQTILNKIIPPRSWGQNEKHYVQYVSTTQTSREDVRNLQNLLDQRLLSHQARDTGICPIREELHSQCFDEIIRQVTLDCPERGLLLMRVRDELKMTISAYLTLYKSATSFGMRKEIEADLGLKGLNETSKDLLSKKQKLLKKKEELENKKKALEKRIDESRVQDQIKRKNEIEFLNYQNEHLKTFFENIQLKQN